jgi:hypothetical protein
VSRWKFRDSDVRIVPPPEAFRGRFADFYADFIEPNLPAPERVEQFDALLCAYLEGDRPLHVLRKLPGQARGVEYVTEAGERVLPGDNAPGWWLHAALLSGTPPPEDPEALFRDMPTHFFQVARRYTLSAAGFHLAHVLDVGNRDTRWPAWGSSELRRRMLLNLHPCNWFLLAKSGWVTAGRDPAIVAWVEHAYARRYARVFEAFRDSVGRAWGPGPAPDSPLYAYQPRPARNASARQTPRTNAGGGPRPPGSVLAMNRPVVRRCLQGTDVVLEILTEGKRYLVPHDALLGWVRSNTGALRTRSWAVGGIYSWPRPTRKMRQFLEGYRVP